MAAATVRSEAVRDLVSPGRHDQYRRHQHRHLGAMPRLVAAVALVSAIAAGTGPLRAPGSSALGGLTGATVRPSSTTAGSTGNSFTFSFVAPAGGLSDGAVTISGSTAWTAPSTVAGSAGLTTASNGQVAVRPAAPPDDLAEVAGTPQSLGCPSSGAAAMAAHLSRPTGVSVDAGGDLYVSDPGCASVEMVPATSGTYFGRTMTGGDVYVVAGTVEHFGCELFGGPATSAWIDGPAQLALDANDDLYVADAACNTVDIVPQSSGSIFGRAMTAGHIYVVAGVANVGGCSGVGGTATAAHLSAPGGVAVDAAGDLYIADTGCDTLDMVPAASGTYFGQAMTAGDLYVIAGATAVAGCGGNGGTAAGAGFGAPSSVAIDATGDLYVADPGCETVDLLPLASGAFFGRTMAADHLYVIAGSDGVSSCTGNGGPASSATVEVPSGVALDTSGDVILADSGCETIDVIAASDRTAFGKTLTAGDLYVVGGQSGSAGCAKAPGPATSSDLWAPSDAAVDGAGDIYVADPGDCALVQVISATADWTLTVSALSLAAGQQLSVDWGASGGTTGVTAPPTSGTFTFVTAESPSPGLLPATLGPPPTVTVAMAAAPGFLGPPSAPAVAVTLGGRDAVATATTSADVGDSGWTGGWTIAAAATPFLCGAGSGGCSAGASLGASVTIPAVSPPTVSCDGGAGSCTPATDPLTYPIALPIGPGPPTAVPVFAAAPATGVGDETVRFTWVETVPAEALSGAYVSTWTFTLTEGP